MPARESAAPSPSARDIFVYYPVIPGGEHGPAQWGTPVIVDADGNPIPAPPPFTTQIDPDTGKPQLILVDPDKGTILHSEETHDPIGLPEYHAPVSSIPLEVPTGEEEQQPAEAPDVETPEAEEGGTAGAAEEAWAPETATAVPAGPEIIETEESVPAAGRAGVLEEVAVADEAAGVRAATDSGTGLTDEELHSLASPAPEPIEVADIVGLGAEEISATPITLPDPADAEERARGVVGLGDEVISATPITLPDPPDVAGVATLGAEEISATPITLPDPAALEPGEVEMGESVAAAIDLSEPFETESRLADLTPLTIEETAGRSALPEELPEEDEPRG
ncbi:MAG TPA: hypothetical protein VLS92_06500 [Acidimicrobiia bacterium]|nr:hypothetical protein [Acidimicrobiia bacterium]